MTREEVLVHPVYLRLSDSHKKFIAELMGNGNDKKAAAHMTWQCKDDASAEAMANKALRKPAIRYLMDGYLGVDVTKTIPSRDELAAFAWGKAQLANDGNESHKWASMVSRVMGYDIKPQAGPDTPTEPTLPGDDSDEEFS